MKAFARFTAVLLTLVMVLSMAACGGDITWVAKRGDNTIPVGVYIFYLNSLASEAKQKEGVDPTIPVLDQEIDGVPAEKWIIDEAKKKVKRMLAADEWMAEFGVDVDQEDKAYAESMLEQYWSYFYQEMYEPMGIAQSSLFMASDLQTLKETAVFKAIYDKGGEKEISQADVEKEYLENYYNISTITASILDPETSEAISDDEINAIGAILEGYKADLESGKSFAEVQAAYDAAHADADEDASSDADASSDTESEAADTDLELSFYEKTDTQYDPENQTEVDKQILAMKPGEMTILNDGSYLYICIRNDETKTKQAFYDDDDKRLTAMQLLKQDEFDELLEARTEAVEVEFNEAVLKKYRPKSPEVDQASSGAESSDPESTADGSSVEEDAAAPDEEENGASSNAGDSSAAEE